jgi:hypothetical protein
MRRVVAPFAAAVAAAVLLLQPLPSPAAITAEQKQKAQQIEEKLSQARKEAAAKNYEQAAKLTIEAQFAIVELTGDGKDSAVNKLVEPLISGLNTLRRVLEGKGQKIPPLPKPGERPAAGGVSFTKQIAPIILARCRNCHVNNMQGEFSMASYDALLRGAKGVAVISPGSGKDSRIIEVLESGDMPRGGGGPLRREDIALISKWIDEGARYDGANRADPLATLVPQTQAPALTVVKATGSESSKYSRDIAPVLAAQCTNCHGGQNPRAQLSMDTFQQLLRGSNNGPIIVPGRPADSMLIKKIKGTGDGARMPMGRPPLSDDVIAKFEKWVAEGAKFDGTDPAMDTEKVARIYAATQMSHEELSKERVALADVNWRMSNPDDKPQRYESENFLVLGNVFPERLQEIGKLAEQQQPRVAAILGAPADKPLIKGRLTIFVFNKRFDYAEYGQMVEKREIPDNWRGHWRYDVVDAYACIQPPEYEHDASLAGLVAEQIAGAYLDTHGTLPRWFAQGCAWSVASRIDGKDPRVAKWNDAVPDLVRQMSAADDFLAGKLSPEASAVLNYSFAKYLMGNSSQFRALLSALKNGAEFDKAFVQAYKAEPKVLAAAWARSAATRRR